MKKILIRFYEELNDFIPERMRKRDVEFCFDQERSVKNLIESFGVPHTEVDLILANGVSVTFDYLVEDGDRFSIYPMFETLPVKDVTRLRPEPLRNPRFICDVHLGKLAKRLRLLGFDTIFESGTDDIKLIEISNNETRLLLTRDRQLLMHKTVTRGMFVHEKETDKQVTEILERLSLRDECRPFTRCMVCNGNLESVSFDDTTFELIRESIPAKVLEWCRDYATCLSCGKIYWRGSHYWKLKEWLDHIIA